MLAVDPSNLLALKGLDRILNRTGRYKELLDNLERQIEVAATPRQKITLWERIAALHDEEFLFSITRARPSHKLESLLMIDPSHDAALTSLARHYHRALDRWDDVAKAPRQTALQVLGRRARRIDLLAARAQRPRRSRSRVARAARCCAPTSRCSRLSPDHAGALEALALLREMTGDAHAAITALEALAAKATTPEAKAEQWLRAAQRLEEGRGDKDGAIERYQAALEASPARCHRGGAGAPASVDGARRCNERRRAHPEEGALCTPRGTSPRGGSMASSRGSCATS